MIRPLKQEDRPQLISLLKLNTPDFFDPAEEKDFALYLEQHAEDYYVVEERGKIIAGGGINYGFDKGRTARLSWDLVHPGRHGSGIGSQLVRHRLEQIKKEPGVEQVVVRTTQLVWKFYERFGFRLHKKEKDFWSPGFDLYKMELQVSETGKTQVVRVKEDSKKLGKMIRFETKRLVIKDTEEADFDKLLKIYNRKENMQFIPNADHQWSRWRLKEKYRKHMQNYERGYGIFSVKLKDTNELIGEAGLFNSFDDSKVLELGYILDADFWNRGYGTEICNGLIFYGFEELGLQKLKARMYSANLGSLRLSEKCGMTKVDSGVENGSSFVEYEISNNETNI